MYARARLTDGRGLWLTHGTDTVCERTGSIDDDFSADVPFLLREPVIHASTHYTPTRVFQQRQHRDVVRDGGTLLSSCHCHCEIHPSVVMLAVVVYDSST